jgi:hypothetical protein
MGVLQHSLQSPLEKPAGKALGRLIGSALEIPTAWLDQQAQGIKDATAARSHLTQAIALETANMAVADPVILERAKAAMVATAYRHQVNKDAVALKTIETLQADPPPEDSDGPSEDWLAKFERYAEDASSDQLRTLFEKLLAGEIRKPGDVSPITLHFVSMLDQKTATLIQRVFPYTVFNNADLSSAVTLLDCGDPPLSVEQQLDLERCGFWSFYDGFTNMYDISALGVGIIALKNNLGFTVEGDANGHVTFKASTLSRAGVDLFNITDIVSDVQKIADVALAKESVKRFLYGAMT